MLFRMWVAFALVVLCACPGRLQDPERFMMATGCQLDVEVDIFKPKCALAGCHDATAMQNGLDLETAGIATRLSTGVGSAACSMKPLVSLMGEKINPSPSCGVQMPQGVPLSADEIKCVEAYLGVIADGGTP